MRQSTLHRLFWRERVQSVCLSCSNRGIQNKNKTEITVFSELTCDSTIVLIGKSEAKQRSLQTLHLFLNLQKEAWLFSLEEKHLWPLDLSHTYEKSEKKKGERASEVQNKKGNTPVTTVAVNLP